MKVNYWHKFEEGAFYHVYNRGIDGQDLFFSDENCIYFLKKWKEKLNPYVAVAAYCLIPNHFHFLIRIKPIMESIKHLKKEGTSKSVKLLNGEINYNIFLEDQFKRLFSSYTLSLNKQIGRTGSLFQKRFKRVHVKDENKLWYLLAYIHHNPIHHGLCKEYEEWKYGSYNSFFSDKPTSIIRKEVLTWFDPSDAKNSRKLFLKYHRNFKYDAKIEKFLFD